MRNVTPRTITSDGREKLLRISVPDAMYDLPGDKGSFVDTPLLTEVRTSGRQAASGAENSAPL